MTIKSVKGTFSAINGSTVRIMYSDDGAILGTITKLSDGCGYRVQRFHDGKVRIKKLLSDAYKSVRRKN